MKKIIFSILGLLSINSYANEVFITNVQPAKPIIYSVARGNSVKFKLTFASNVNLRGAKLLAEFSENPIYDVEKNNGQLALAQNSLPKYSFNLANPASGIKYKQEDFEASFVESNPIDIAIGQQTGEIEFKISSKKYPSVTGTLQVSIYAVNSDGEKLSDPAEVFFAIYP